MRKIFSLVLLVSLFLVSCQEEKSDIEQLNTLRKEFWKEKSNESNLKMATQLDSAYKAYIDNHPTDTLIPELMFENARLHLSALKNTDVAIGILENLYKRYPESPRAPEAMYQRGFLLENELHLTDNAIAQYQMLIDKYPEHPFAKEAALTIKFVGKDPEEMLKQITDSAKHETPHMPQ